MNDIENTIRLALEKAFWHGTKYNELTYNMHNDREWCAKYYKDFEGFVEEAITEIMSKKM